MDQRELEDRGRRLFDAVTRGDLDAVLQHGTPDIEFRALLSGVEGRVYRGRDGIAAWLADTRDAWQDRTWRFHHAIPVDDDRAVVVADLATVGRESGIDLSFRLCNAFTFENGLIRRIHTCHTEDEAFAALGVGAREARVRRMFEAVSHGRVEEVEDQMDPDGEFLPIESSATGQSLRGPDGLKVWWRDMQEMFEDSSWDIVEYAQIGDQDAIRVRFRGRARAGGLEFDQPMSQLWSYRDGRAVRCQVFPGDGAFEAVAR